MNDIVAIMRAADYAARKHARQRRKGEEGSLPQESAYVFPIRDLMAADVLDMPNGARAEIDRILNSLVR
jgi:hypothetical protein